MAAIMAVVAQIWRDEYVVGRRRGGFQVPSQLAKIHHVLNTRRAVDDAVKIDEWIVPRGILIPDLRHLGIVRCPERRMSAAGALPLRIATHILHVRLPG